MNRHHNSTTPKICIQRSAARAQCSSKSNAPAAGQNHRLRLINPNGALNSGVNIPRCLAVGPGVFAQRRPICEINLPKGVTGVTFHGGTEVIVRPEHRAILSPLPKIEHGSGIRENVYAAK